MEARNAKQPHETKPNVTLQHFRPKQPTMKPPQDPPYFVVVAPRLEKGPIFVPALAPPKPRNDKALALAVTITLAFIIAIGLPVAAIVPEKYIDKLPINVLVPLYIDPARSAWDRLYKKLVETCLSTVSQGQLTVAHSALTKPNQNFTAIVNPNSGPGAPPFPGVFFGEQVEKIRGLGNIRVVGYVDTARGDRANTVVMTEIQTYAGWSEKSGLTLHGIFFDHTPTTGSKETEEYMKNITGTVKHSSGFLQNLVIQNPGRMPDASLIHAYVDLTVVFEGAYDDVPAHEQMKLDLDSLPGNRQDYGVLVHSFPQKKGRVGLRTLINGLKKDVQYIFVTERDEDVYNAFGRIWDMFLSLLW